VQREPAEQYNHKRIGWELERTAMGDGYYGNALRVAKDIPGLTDQDRAVLDRYATGAQHDTDHIALQDIAMRVYATSRTAHAVQGEPVYLYRRRGLHDFVTCNHDRYAELSVKPHLFETK